MFQNSFDAAPPASVILQHMNLPKLLHAGQGDELTVDADEDDEDEDMWIQLPVDQPSYRSLAVAPRPAPEHPFLDFIGNMVKEHVMKIGACIGMEGHAHPSLNVLSPPRSSTASLAALASGSDNGSDKDIAAYLFALRPFLHGLDNLMQELDMNDPSRV